jgi:hypothetical protein
MRVRRRITQNNGLAAPSGSSQHCCRPVESQRHSTSTAIGVRAPCPLRRSLLAFGIEPGQPRDAHATTQTHGRVAARSTQPRPKLAAPCECGLTAESRPQAQPWFDGEHAPHEEARVVIPDLADPARRLSAAQLMRACVSSSDRTPNPGCTCVACHSKPATGLLPIWYRAR